ncbi:hypothetical protein ACOME3_006397 [Neoechinorhynchus agilis]
MPLTEVTTPCYALVQHSYDCPTESELKKDFENGDEYTKYQALKKLIAAMLNGENYPGLLMTVMRFVMPVKESKKLKKLLLIYWEIVPKHSEDGNLLHEMILVCDAYRKDLTHPNEYVRGATLRFLCKLKEPELLEPIMPAIRSCLEHRHPYVRRNAILAVFTIYQNFPQLISDACELMCTTLEKESDMSCRRNAFMMLIHLNQSRAVQFLSRNEQDVASYGDVLQLIVTELIYRSSISTEYADYKPMFLRLISQMIVSPTTGPSVKFEAANTLLALTTTPKAIRTCAKCLVDIALKESNNNVKLIVIEKLTALGNKYGDRNILQDLAVDIIPVMNSNDMLVTQQTLELINSLTNGRNIDNIIQILKRELGRSQSSSGGGWDKETNEKRTHLITQSLHEIITTKFRNQAQNVIEVLIEFLPQANETSAMEILQTIKDVLIDQPACISTVLPKLVDTFQLIEVASVLAGCCWILSEFTFDDDLLGRKVLDMLLETISDANQQLNQKENKPQVSTTMTTDDGIYATQSALQMTTSENRQRSGVWSLIVENGEYHLATAISVAITKLNIRLSRDQSRRENAIRGICGLLNHCTENRIEGKSVISKDEFERIVLCLKLLTSHGQLPLMFAKRHQQKIYRESKIKPSPDWKDVHETPEFAGFLNSINEPRHNALDETLRLAAIGQKQDNDDIDDHFLVHQLTESLVRHISDPIYCECVLKISSYFDIGLEILLVNQTSETIQNVQVELFTVGEMKVTQKAPTLNLAPHASAYVQSHIKVNATESATIYGNLVYHLSSGKPVLIVLNEMGVDVVDFAKIPTNSPADDEFREMWRVLEWENKIAVQASPGLSMNGYLANVTKATKMKVLACQHVDDFSEDGSVEGGFLSANLYGQSAFGEDVIANLSLGACGSTISGHLKIRAKNQRMALTMGDRVTKRQASFKEIS